MFILPPLLLTYSSSVVQGFDHGLVGVAAG
jgi:hypothetical protein